MSSISDEMTSQRRVSNETEIPEEHTNTLSLIFLVVSHGIELITMSVATASFALTYQQSVSHINSSEIVIILNYKTGFTVYEFVITFYVILIIAPLLIITSISFVWIIRSQSFSGCTAECLVCWFLHLFQVSFLWRYAKFKLAYDQNELSELGILRFVQVHIQTLPFLVLHVTVTFTFQQSLECSIACGVVLLVSCVVTIVVATTVRRKPSQSSLSLPTITQVCNTSLNEDDKEPTKRDDLIVRFVVGLTILCVLWCRIGSIAALFCLNAMWAVVILLVYWILSISWVTFQEEIQLVTINSTKKLLRRAFLGYLLLWDWHVFRDDASALNVCAKPKLPAIFYSIVTIQNISSSIVWFIIKCYDSATDFCLNALTSILTAQGIALLLLTLSYIYCFSSLPVWVQEIMQHMNMNMLSDLTLKRASINDPQLKSSSTKEIKCPSSTSYVDFKDTENNGSAIEEHLDIDESLSGTERSNFYHKNLAFSLHYPEDIFKSKDNKHTLNSVWVPKPPSPERSLIDDNSIYYLHCSCANKSNYLLCSKTNQSNPQENKVLNSFNLHYRMRRHSSYQNGYCHPKIFDIIDIENNTIIPRVYECNQPVNTYPLEKVSIKRGLHTLQTICPNCNQSKNYYDEFQPYYPNTGALNLRNSCIGICDSEDQFSSDGSKSTDNLPVIKGISFSNLLLREKGGHDYVTAWLRHQQSIDTFKTSCLGPHVNQEDSTLNPKFINEKQSLNFIKDLEIFI